MYEQFKRFKPIISDLLKIATPAEIHKISVMNETMKYCETVSKPDLQKSAEEGMHAMLTRLEKRLQKKQRK